MRKAVYNLIITVTFCTIWSCGRDNNFIPVQTDIAANEIQGEWLWPCLEISDQNQSASTQLYENYDSGSYTGIYYVYASTNCTGTVQATNTATGTYTIGADINSDNTPSVIATEIDFDLPSVSTAGENTYVQLVEQYVIWGTGGQFYDIFYVNNSQLFFGDYSTGDGATPSTRPTSIYLSGFAVPL